MLSQDLFPSSLHSSWTYKEQTRSISQLAFLEQLIHDLIFSESRWMMLQRLGIVFHHALPANADGETAMLGNTFRICWSLVTKGTLKS